MSTNGATELLMKLSDIERNPMYRQEHEMHATFCNGEGYMLEFNAFTLEHVEKECPFCKRIKAYRMTKRIEKAQIEHGQTGYREDTAITEETD